LRPAKIIRHTLQETDESHLQPSDLKSISQSLYRQRRNEYPALPKDRMETHACLENLAVKTSKDENFLAYNVNFSIPRLTKMKPTTFNFDFPEFFT
jgi:hypothetical protein